MSVVYPCPEVSQSIHHETISQPTGFFSAKLLAHLREGKTETTCCSDAAGNVEQDIESVSEGLSGWTGPVVTDTLVYPCIRAQDSVWEGFLSGFSKGHGGTSLLAPGSAVLLRVSSPSIPRVELGISHPDQWLTFVLFLLFFFQSSKTKAFFFFFLF